MPVPAAGPAPDTACNAPFSSMHIMPNGDVRACCQNVWHPMGSVTRSTLREIWDGARADALRARLTQGDLGLGCELCAVEVATGSGANALFHAFDDLAPTDGSREWPRQLELTLSTDCNLQCVMCNGEFSSSIRLHREGRPPAPRVFDDTFFDELDQFLPHLDRITFLGGEPLMGPEPLRVLDRLIDLGLRPHCNIVTNGTQWNRRVQRILEQLPVQVVVSVDGATAATNESIRLGVDHGRLLHNIERIRSATAATGGGCSLAFSLMNTNWHELADVLAWADDLGCGVNINTVTNPPRFSLHALDATGISAVLDGMARRDDWATKHLHGTLDTWRSTMRHVESLVAASRDPRLRDQDPLAAARRAAERWAPGTVVRTMSVDDSLIISGFGPDPTDLFGVDGRDLVGRSSVSFMRALSPALGVLVDTGLELVAGGVERRIFEFDDGRHRRSLLAAMAKQPEGEVWFLALRESGVRSVPVEIRAS